MDRYQRVEKPKNETAISENEVRITTQGKTRNYITYSISLFQDNKTEDVVLKAMGRAINKAVTIAEVIKRRVAGLHQITTIGSTDITDTWEPLEEGLTPLETVRHVSMISITLSKAPLDETALGYQPPLPIDQVKPYVEAEYDAGEASPPGGRGRGQGRGRGRGRARGFNNPEYGPPEGGANFEGGFTRGRGRGRARGRGRGRGRGYNADSFQGRGGGRGYGYEEPRGYEEDAGQYEETVVPRRGRGRGRANNEGGGGRGRGGGYYEDAGTGRGRGGYYEDAGTGRGRGGGYYEDAGGRQGGRGGGYHEDAGRGRGRNYYDDANKGNYYEDAGRGRGGRRGGRGGGYGGDDHQQQQDGPPYEGVYDEAGGYRGRGGRGRGRGRGRARGGGGGGGRRNFQE